MSQQKITVVYATKYGSTQRYAQWIAEELGAELVSFEKADINQLALCDTVIFGSCVYAGRIQGINFMKNNRDTLEHTRLLIFTVGLTQPGDEVAYQQVLDKNFTEEERKGLQFFHFPGALDYKKMNFMERHMMRILKGSIKKKPEEKRNQMEAYILETYGGKIDFTNRAYIEPLVKTARERETV